MLELLTFALGLAALIMGWKYVTKTLDWFANNMSRTGDLVQDLTVSASYQTQRGVIISHDTLEDSIFESKKKAVKRSKDMKSFSKGLGEDEKKEIESHNKTLNDILARKYQ
jgi:hypothetical protein